MSKADEMFEKLGYKDKITDDFKIKYNNLLHKEQIVFYFQTKTVEAKTFGYSSININMQELQAINEKVKELGWNE